MPCAQLFIVPSNEFPLYFSDPNNPPCEASNLPVLNQSVGAGEGEARQPQWVIRHVMIIRSITNWFILHQRKCPNRNVPRDLRADFSGGLIPPYSYLFARKASQVRAKGEVPRQEEENAILNVEYYYFALSLSLVEKKSLWHELYPIIVRALVQIIVNRWRPLTRHNYGDRDR